jgi:murein DD-endopeptidase MepM/ murein hydrolase activator NlpD
MPKITRRRALKTLIGTVSAALLATPFDLKSQTAESFGLPFATPAGLSTWYVSQWYGNTRFAYRQRNVFYQGGQGLHFGIDFFAPCGTTVIAIGDGTVAAVDGPYGSAPHNVLIRHSNGYASLYGHLLYKSELSVGQRIKKGEKVGVSGLFTVSAVTGQPTGADCDTAPHLHLEIRTPDLSGAINPVNFIETNWHDFTLGLDLEGQKFALDLANPGRWQTIYDQPNLRFGSPLINQAGQFWTE